MPKSIPSAKDEVVLGIHAFLTGSSLSTIVKEALEVTVV
jgi:hypothetical protein